MISEDDWNHLPEHIQAAIQMERTAHSEELEAAHRQVEELHVEIVAAKKELDASTETMATARRLMEEQYGLLNIRDATLAERDKEIELLRMRLESDTRRMNEALEDASKWNGIAIARKKLTLEACDIIDDPNGAGGGAEHEMNPHRRAAEIRKEVETRDLTELAQWVIQQVCRPPMACYTCEQHNEELCTLINVMNALCVVLDDEFMRVVAGYPWNTARIFDEVKLHRARCERLSRPLGELLARITEHGPGDPLSDEDYDTLLKSMGKRPIILGPPEEPYVSPPLMSNRQDLDAIEKDVVVYGTGFGRLRPDGRIEHVPAQDVMVYHSKAGGLASDWGKNLMEKLKEINHG